jgi:uncharacterized protein YoaH (UPF0181 family)
MNGSSMRADVMARQHFLSLRHEEQAQAIRRLAAVGHGELTISHATGLAIEVIKRVLAEGMSHT